MRTNRSAIEPHCGENKALLSEERLKSITASLEISFMVVQGAHRESVSKFPVFSLCFPCQPEVSLIYVYKLEHIYSYYYYITYKKQGWRLTVVTRFSVGPPDFKKWWSNRPQDFLATIFIICFYKLILF